MFFYLSHLLQNQLSFHCARIHGAWYVFKCSFADIVTFIRYWVVHIITIPSLFIVGLLFASRGLAYLL